MKTSTAGKILVALAVTTMVGGLSIGTALGEDNGRRQAQENRGGHERDRHDNQRDRYDDRGWRDSRGWHAYRPFYAPPPVVYAPAPSPGISFFFPLFR